MIEFDQDDTEINNEQDEMLKELFEMKNRQEEMMEILQVRCGNEEREKIGTNLIHILFRYKVDWIACGVLAIILKLAIPHHARERQYRNDDPSIMYDYHADTVSDTVLAVIAAVIPLVVGTLCSLLFGRLIAAQRWNTWLDIHHFILGLVESHVVAGFFTVALKFGIGRVRPSGLARLAMNNASWNMSYPSGHTSSAFTGMVYLSLFLVGKTGIFRKHGLYFKLDRDPFAGSFAQALIVIFVPSCVATYVGASRLFDYAHDFSDVNAGAFIGVFAALVGYFCNYPSVTHSSCGFPRPALI